MDEVTSESESERDETPVRESAMNPGSRGLGRLCWKEGVFGTEKKSGTPTGSRAVSTDPEARQYNKRNSA